MKKGQCKDALEIYKRFLTRMTRVSEFLKVAEVSNIKLCWKYNLRILTYVSGVNNRVYDLSRHSVPEPQCARVGSDLRGHVVRLLAQNSTLLLRPSWMTSLCSNTGVLDTEKIHSSARWFNPPSYLMAIFDHKEGLPFFTEL